MPAKQLTPGQRLRAARERAGVTQAQLAERMGSAQATISDVERGQPATLDWMYAAAVALGYRPIVDLFGEGD